MLYQASDCAAHIMGDDQAFLAKLQRNPVGIEGTTRSNFTINHYAGTVQYFHPGMVAANRARISDDTRLRMSVSSSKKPVTSYYTALEAAARERSGKNRLNRTMWSITGRALAAYKELTARLENANRFYMRCIKANEHQLPYILDQECLRKQLKHLTVDMSLSVMADGYPYRYSFAKFIVK